LTKRWIRVLLSLAVSVPVGLAPYLGKVRIPLFKPLLDLFPQSIADAAIIFSTAAMSIVAAFVQFHGSDKTPLEDIDAKFRIGTRYCIVLLSLLLIMYFVTVTRVPVLGGADRVSFVTGFTGSRDPNCVGKSSAQCILTVTRLDEANIDWSFGEQQIRLARALLVIVYVSFMSTFAYLIALIALREWAAGALIGRGLTTPLSVAPATSSNPTKASL
jgi:hypothetical protein